MQIGKAFSFSFEDKSWVSKFLLAAVISIVPILNFAWTGYIVELVKNVIDRRQEPLPDWGDFGKKFIDGLIVTVAYFIYSLPALLVLCVMTALYLIPVIVQSGGKVSQDTFNAMMTGAGLITFCLVCLVVIYALVLTVLLPGILANFAQKRTFGSCFELGQVYGTVAAHGSSYFMVVLMIIVASVGVGLVAALVTSFISFIPILGWCFGWLVGILIWLFTVPYVGAVTGHLVGQYGAEAYNLPAEMTPGPDVTMVR